MTTKSSTDQSLDGDSEQRFGEITEKFTERGWTEIHHVYSIKPLKSETNEAFRARVRRWAETLISVLGNALHAEAKYHLQADKIVRGEIILRLVAAANILSMPTPTEVAA